jgi:uncharacterized membrane protein YkoI
MEEVAMRRLIEGLALCSVVELVILVGTVRAEEQKVPLDKVPKAVLDAVKSKFPEAKLLGAEIEKEDGKTHYEIALKNKDQKIELLLTPEGQLVSMEKVIAAKDLPKAVTEALEAKYPKATYKVIEEVIEIKDGKEQPAVYEVLLVTSEKNKVEVVLAADGKITKEEKKEKKKDN